MFLIWMECIDVEVMYRNANDFRHANGNAICLLLHPAKYLGCLLIKLCIDLKKKHSGNMFNKV